MGVNIDEARGNDPAGGIDLFVRVAVDHADGGNTVAGDGDVGLERLRPCAVDHQAAADDEIVFHPATPERTSASFAGWDRKGECPPGSTVGVMPKRSSDILRCLSGSMIRSSEVQITAATRSR